MWNKVEQDYYDSNVLLYFSIILLSKYFFFMKFETRVSFHLYIMHMYMFFRIKYYINRFEKVIFNNFLKMHMS